MSLWMRLLQIAGYFAAWYFSGLFLAIVFIRKHSDIDGDNIRLISWMSIFGPLGAWISFIKTMPYKTTLFKRYRHYETHTGDKDAN